MDVDALAVVVKGGLATVQDTGRPGWAEIGVPPSGAWHRTRHHLCTELVGVPGGPAMELLAGDIVLSVRQATVIAALGSAELSVDSSPVPVGVAIAVGVAAEVTVRHIGPGPCYLAIAGWEPPQVLGSASVDTFSRIGGGPLTAGEVLTGRGVAAASAGRFLRDLPAESGPLRVLPSDSDSWIGEPWQVVTTTRSGSRLRGAQVPSSASLPSAPMVVGAIQITPAGEAIILGPDSGVTGGYPVLGCVITADLSRVSDLRVGEQVKFAAVTIDEACAAHDEKPGLARGVLDPRDLR